MELKVREATEKDLDFKKNLLILCGPTTETIEVSTDYNDDSTAVAKVDTFEDDPDVKKFGGIPNDEVDNATNGDIEASLNSQNVAPSIIDENINEDDVTKASANYLNLDEVKKSVRKLTNDDYLTVMVHTNNPYGYVVYKDACSKTGISATELARKLRTAFSSILLLSFP